MVPRLTTIPQTRTQQIMITDKTVAVPMPRFPGLKPKDEAVRIDLPWAEDVSVRAGVPVGLRDGYPSAEAGAKALQAITQHEVPAAILYQAGDKFYGAGAYHSWTETWSDGYYRYTRQRSEPYSIGKFDNERGVKFPNRTVHALIDGGLVITNPTPGVTK